MIIVIIAKLEYLKMVTNDGENSKKFTLISITTLILFEIVIMNMIIGILKI